MGLLLGLGMKWY